MGVSQTGNLCCPLPLVDSFSDERTFLWWFTLEGCFKYVGGHTRQARPSVLDSPCFLVVRPGYGAEHADTLSPGL